MLFNDLTRWLNHPDFRDALLWAPESFGWETTLAPYLNQVIETWLSELIGETQINLLTILINPPLGTVLTDLEITQISLTAKFLAHATWSRYVINSGVTATESGLVIKETDTSMPLSDGQRSQISRDHKALAEHYALKLRKLLPVEGCPSPGVGSGSPQFRTVRGRRRSRFD